MSAPATPIQDTEDHTGDHLAPPPALLALALAFMRISMMSIGGGVSGWMMREFVDRQRWMTQKEFLTGLALAQSFPGVNVVNLSIWIGFRLRGGIGAIAAALGMIVPSGIIAIVLVTLFDRMTNNHGINMLLAGAAVAAIGMSLSMGIRATRTAAIHIFPALVIAAMFLALFVLQLPLLPVILVMAPLSVGVSFWRLRQRGPRP